VLSGYLGRPEAWSFVLEALAAVQQQRPDAWYVCDPVLGDEGELYLPAKLVRTFREQAVPRADLLVPNRFELQWLVDRPVGSVAEAVAAAGDLHAAGAREVVVKGLVLEHDGRPTQHVVGLDDDGAWLARAPHVEQFWSGSGDVFTALIAGLRLLGIPLAETVARATALMEELIARTHELDSPELRMVEIDWAAEPPGAHAVRVA
jgi:pyridoxine kinase